jgi:DNA repair exonuclease SbcCD nuclease subunit
MRFLHVADVHLDTSFAGRSAAVRERLREASREAFQRAVDVAIREEVQAFLIAGDLFDGDRLSFQTERFLLEQTARLADHGIAVIYATGNHDPHSTSAGPRPLPWPSAVRVAGDATPQRIEIHDGTGAPIGYVTAVGHASAQESRDLSRLLPRPEGALPEVALLHTQVHASLGAEEHHAYAPSELAYLTRAGYDYWALGHVHLRQELSADPPVWYAGSLQGRTHADRGERGALLVDLSDRQAPLVAFRSLARVRWDTLEVDRLEGLHTLDELERRIQTVWATQRGAELADGAVEWMIRVVLRGPCPLWAEVRQEEDRDVLARELQELLGALDVTVVADDVHPIIPLDEHRGRTDVLGEALRLAEALRRSGDGLPQITTGDFAAVLAGGDGDLGRYVRELLRGADGELATRLLASGAGEP